MAEPPPDPSQVTRVAGLLAGARRALFITGAGMSADSGLPTYRGIGGLYERDAAAEGGVPIEVALSGAMLEQDPALCWRHIGRIERACRGAQPNAGHRVLRDLQVLVPHVCVFTQNVDGLHQAAGSSIVIAIHGDVHRLRCTLRGCSYRETVRDYAHLELPPRCPECGGIARPDVVLFGEALPGPELQRFAAELERGFDVVCSIGTSSLFAYIVEPVLAAARSGVPTVEINPGRTDISPLVDVHLRARAAPALEAIWQALRPA
jgi:NAD-dependent deacetylase